MEDFEPYDRLKQMEVDVVQPPERVENGYNRLWSVTLMLSNRPQQLLLHKAHLDQINVDGDEYDQQDDLVDQVNNGKRFFAKNEQITFIPRQLQADDANEKDDIDDGKNPVLF